METPKTIVKKDTKNKLRCPHCGNIMYGRVKDSRLGKGIGLSDIEEPTIYRRRKCSVCGIRFTSFEIVAQVKGISFTYAEMVRWVRLGRAVEQLIRNLRTVKLDDLASLLVNFCNENSFLSLAQLQQMGFCAGIDVAKGSSASVETVVDKEKMEGA